MKKQVPNKNSSSVKKKTKFESASLVIKSFLIILIVTCFIIGICMLIYVASFKNGKLAINMDDYKDNQNQTSIIYATKDDGSEVEIARLHGLENRIWVKYDDMPQSVKDAFVALEDKRFNNHHGVDWKRTISAATIHHFSQGGSTITQQLIKNLTNENAPTFSRKFNEICYALNLEKHYSKVEILEAYLNTIPLGSGCYGVQTAAKTYFGKDAKDLNIAESAVLASITKAPTRYNPLLNPNNNKKRQEVCLKMMYEQEYISKEQYEEAKNYKLVFTNSPEYVPSEDDYTTKKQIEKTKIQSYYVDYVIDTVINDFMEKYGYDKSKATRMIYYGGLKIHSCVDLNVQKEMENVYENRITFPRESSRTEKGENGTKKKAQSSMVIMDYKGKVVGIVGGAGKKTANRDLNRAVKSPRQPGSSIKPLSVYAPAIDKNIINWSSSIENYKVMINGKPYFHNYNGTYGTEGEFVTVQYALAKSLNTVPARILKQMGLHTSINYLSNNFHLSHLILSGKHSDENMSSLGVGGMSKGVTTLEMAAAFATFGNNGYYYKPYCYTKVTSSDGKKVYFENNPVGKRALKAGTADVMNELLRTVITGGTGSAYGVSGFTTFAKTGTTSEFKDKWFVGGTPHYVGAVWYGYDNNESLKGIGGSNPSGKIFKAVMNPIHKNLPKKYFKKSGETVQRTYCEKSGKLAGPTCEKKRVGWYKTGKYPETCDGSCNEVPEETTDPNAPVDPSDPSDPSDTTGEITKPVDGTVPSVPKPTPIPSDDDD